MYIEPKTETETERLDREEVERAMDVARLYGLTKRIVYEIERSMPAKEPQC